MLLGELHQGVDGSVVGEVQPERAFLRAGGERDVCVHYACTRFLEFLYDFFADEAAASGYNDNFIFYSKHSFNTS